MLQDSQDASKVVTPPLPGAVVRHANLNVYNSLSKPEAKDGDVDSYTVTLVTSPAGRRSSAYEEPAVDEAKSQPLMAQKQPTTVSKSMHFTSAMLQASQNDTNVSMSH